jgi:hypothetical protein
VREGDRLPPGADVVLVARRDIRELADREGLGGVANRLGQLIARVVGPGGEGDVAPGPGRDLG